ncbi:MAG: serine hydrolase domain-containing protein [Planctomycetota bacterium]
MTPAKLARTLLVLVALLAAAASPAQAQKKRGDKPIVAGELGEALDAAVLAAGGDELWGAVLVARKGEILLAKGYGYADYDEAPNTPRTLFEIASISKQVTAAAILHLQQKRKLKVTDTLDEFFDDVPEDKRGIQLHHLLTHTAGIPGSLGVPYASPLARGPYVKQMLASPFEPAGEGFEYSNVGYALLAAVVEEASGKSFEEYVEKNLFKPAKLKDTGFIGDRDLIKSGRAAARRGKGPEGSTAADWFWGWGYRGMGGVVTTVYDLYAWDQALRGDKVLGKQAKKALYEPYLDGYAYGWRVHTNKRGTRTASHSGGVAGFGSNLVRYLEDDVCIIALCNHGKTAYEVSAAVERVLWK